MHLIAALFALLFSFSQAASLQKTESHPQALSPISAAAQLPDEASDYAGNGCTSCLQMNTPSNGQLN